MAESNVSKKEKNTAMKLAVWRKRLADSDAAFSRETGKMDERERMYTGDSTLRPLVPGDHKRDGQPKKTSHVRNIVFENIESQISSDIPQPKVTPRRKKDEKLAGIIENFLRNELNRLPFEIMNDMAERTVPIQGGAGFMVEWDNTKRTHTTVGEIGVSVIHPKQLAPQPGVYTGIQDMDWFIIKIPTTKEAVKRRYGVDIHNESEAEPNVRGHDGECSTDDSVTQYMGFERTGSGGINRYSWVNDVVIEDLENYQARRVNDETQEHELIHTKKGAVKVPQYKPDIYPVVLQRSVTVYGQLLGSSDVDMIRDQQNTINRMEQKVIDRLVKAGTRITLPDRADIRLDPEDGEKIYIGNRADRDLIGVYDFTGNLQYELSYLNGVYEEARQILGITDSFQGRRDTTAVSGKAKEFAAAQSAGRLDSKRTMKDAAYAAIFEMMFKFALAYSDEPRQVVFKNYKGENEYLSFNRYDFLEQDDNGEWYWNDQFLFTCDSTASLASNREAMWNETRLNLNTGAFGNPTQMETLMLFWSKMEELHYPGASTTKAFLEERMKAEKEAEKKASAAMPVNAKEIPLVANDNTGKERNDDSMQNSIPIDVIQQIEQRAMQDAMRDCGMNDNNSGDAVRVPANAISPELMRQIEQQAWNDVMRDCGVMP
jgi:hypothetical protein